MTPAILLGFGIYQHPCGNADTLVETARMTEAAGFDGLVVSEHLVMGERTDRYQWGRYPGESSDPWLDPLVTLPMVGAVTSRLRLTTGIMIAPLRPAVLLAKAAATIDRMTGGRLELGVGTGWQPEEFQAVGADFESRGQLLTDTIAACRALWRESGAVGFSSRTVSFDPVWCEPKPTTPNGPTVLFSGTLTPRNVRRIVELGDGWIPIMGATPDEVIAGAELLRERLAEAGRDPAALRVRAALKVVRDESGRPLLGPTLEQAHRFGEAGISDVALPLAAFLHEVDEREAWFDTAARELEKLR